MARFPGADQLRGTRATQRDAEAGLAKPDEVGRSWYELTSQACDPARRSSASDQQAEAVCTPACSTLRAAETQPGSATVKGVLLEGIPMADHNPA